MTWELRDQGLTVGRRRIARPMRDNDLRARQKRRFKRTTDSEHGWPVAPNLLDRDFSATAPNQKWSADITYVWTREGWLYLAIVMDLFSRRIIGWAVIDRLHRNLVVTALRQAFAIRRPAAGLICHSDRGSQYCSIDYQAGLRKHGAFISMSGRGNCYDNAMVETFFKTLKSELVWRTIFMTRRHAEAAVGSYIDRFYNPVRRHSSMDFDSPSAYERHAARSIMALHFSDASPRTNKLHQCRWIPGPLDGFVLGFSGHSIADFKDGAKRLANTVAKFPLK